MITISTGLALKAKQLKGCGEKKITLCVLGNLATFIKLKGLGLNVLMKEVKVQRKRLHCVSAQLLVFVVF